MKTDKKGRRDFKDYEGRYSDELHVGYHFLDHELYDFAKYLRGRYKISLEVNVFDVDKWVYFDRGCGFVNAYRCSVLANYSRIENMYGGDDDEEEFWFSVIAKLCELNFNPKVLNPPNDGKYKEGFYKFTHELFEEWYSGSDIYKDTIGEYVYYNGAFLAPARAWKAWRKAIDFNFLNSNECQYKMTLIIEMLSKLNSGKD